MGRSEEFEPFAHSVDLRHRRLFLSGDVDEAMAARVMVACSLMDAENSELLVIINSCGGSVDDGFAIYDTLRSCKAKVTTRGVGKVMSMAVLILQAGDERQLSPNTVVMLHSMSRYGNDYLPNEVRNIRDLERQQLRYAEIISEPMNLKPTEFIRRFEKNSYFDAEKAVKAGLADKVA